MKLSTDESHLTKCDAEEVVRETKNQGYSYQLHLPTSMGVFGFCSVDFANLACISLSKIGGSRGIGSRQRSEAATITYRTEIKPVSSFLLLMQQKLYKKVKYTVGIGYG